jgi:tetratricopeptide (TPR) repeat protein
MVYEGSASWRKIAPDDSISNPGALALEVDFPQLAIKFFATFEKMRDDNSTAPFALTMRVARTTAPGVKETGFQLTGNIGAPSVMGSGYVGPLRFAGPVVRVIGNTFQASIANADVAFDLAALKEGARLDIPLPAIPGIHNGEEGFDLVIDIGEGAAGDARDLATLWQQPAPAPEAPSNAVETKAAPTQAVPVGSLDEGKAEVPAGGDGEAPGRAPPPASAGNGDASAASPPDSKPGDAQEAARVDPDAAAQHYNRGAMQQAQGKFDGAIAEYRVAIGLDAANADVHRDLGAMLKQQGMLEDAAVELREAIRLKPDGAQAHQFLGEVRLEQQAFDAAVAEYREAIRLAPNEAAPHRLLGAAMIEIARGKAGDQQVARLQEACDELARGAALAPSDPNFPILEGIVEASLAQRGHCPP